MRYLLPAICLSLPLLVSDLAAQGLQPSASMARVGGNACVVAKKLGNSLAIEWAVGQPSVSSAIEKAKSALRAKGYTYTFPQANSPLPHGWLVVVKTEYTSRTNHRRVSYGCGFSGQSAAAAEAAALVDLRNYSWGWRKKHGYEVIEKKRF